MVAVADLGEDEEARIAPQEAEAADFARSSREISRGAAGAALIRVRRVGQTIHHHTS